MTLSAIYERFIASPNPLSLAENASLHYVPTLKSFSEQGPIIKHLESQNKDVVKIKSAKIINTIEGANAIAVEVDTTLEFISGGGAYLPGLENFIVDKIATVPMTHIVVFDQEQKIKQIRISWDQASLLKQTEVIGSRGRAWPVFDGKDQIRIISSSSSAAPADVATTPRGRKTDENEAPVRNPSPSKKYRKDPHTSLDTFWNESQKNDQILSPSSDARPLAPRASAKPPPREMSELFAAGHEDLEPSAANGGSPKKSYTVQAVAPKGAGASKFGPARIFGGDEETKTHGGYKSNPAKYNHFDLGDADENDPLQHKPGNAAQATKVPMRARTNKHQSQWDFDDFNTPAKVSQKVRPNDVIHIGWGDEAQGKDTTDKVSQKPRKDNEAHFELKDDGTPIDRHAAPKARPDAETHFEFRDEATPAPRRIIARTEAAQGLYRSIFDDDEKAPLTTITNNANRKHDFGSHWEMTDESPSNGKITNENKGVRDDHKKAVQMMNSNWNSYEQSPEPSKRPTSKSFKKGLESQWTMGVDDDQAQEPRKPTTQAQKNFWDF